MTSWMQELHGAISNDDMATFRSILSKEEVRKDLEVTGGHMLYVQQQQQPSNL